MNEINLKKIIFESFLLIAYICVIVFFVGHFIKNGAPISMTSNNKETLINTNEVEEVYEYYYAHLNNNEKLLYKEFKNASLKYINKFTSNVEDITNEEAGNAFRALFYDHPEIFWLNKYTLSTNNLNSSFELEYFYSEEEVKTLIEQMKYYYEPLLKEANKLEDEKAKITFIYDELIKRGKYYEGNLIPENKSFYQTIVSLMTTGDTVCSGFTYSFKFLMDRLNIKSFSIPDMEKVNTSDSHVWNAVKIDDKWYYLDLTWDNKNYKNNNNYHDFFLLDKELFYQTHTLQSNLPN